VRCEPAAPAARVWRARLRLGWLVQDPHDRGGGEAGEFLDPCDAQTGSGGLAHRVIAAHGPPVAQVVLGCVPLRWAPDACTTPRCRGQAGGRYLVCPVCFNAKQLDKGDLITGAELGGSVQLWEWIGDEAATTFSY